MTKNRSTVELIIEILDTLNQKSDMSKTRLFTSVGIPFQYWNKYLNLILSNELIIINNTRISLSEKGRQALKSFETFMSYIQGIDIQ